MDLETLAKDLHKTLLPTCEWEDEGFPKNKRDFYVLARHVSRMILEARIEGVESGYMIAKGYSNPKQGKDEYIAKIHEQLTALGEKEKSDGRR